MPRNASRVADDDLSEFLDLNPTGRTRACKVGTVLAQLDPDDAARLVKALAQPKEIIATPAIDAWIHRRGDRITLPPGKTYNSAIINHRRGICSCAREAGDTR